MRITMRFLFVLSLLSFCNIHCTTETNTNKTETKREPVRAASAPSTQKEQTKETTTRRKTAISVEQSANVLYPESKDEKKRKEAMLACTDSDEEKQIICLLENFYPDKDSKKLAVQLFENVGIVAGVEVTYTEEVGYRGIIDFVPEMPIGKYSKHLQWVVDSFEDIDDFIKHIESKATDPISYRWYDLELKFYRTVKRRTPNAYATSWWVAYNVEGSMFHSLVIVRETMFHEIFHMNDRDHNDWSEKKLQDIYDAVLAKCTKKGVKLPSTECLAPYSPGTTKVKGGTYYSFQPGNDVKEYAAELALRYYQEQRAYWKKDKKKPKAFKCGPEENQKAWKLLADEFFQGVDLVPECKK